MKTKWFFLGCLTSVLLTFGVILLSVFGLIKLSTKYAQKESVKVNPGSILHLNISGEIVEYNEYYDNFFSDMGTGSHEIIQKINYAAQDDNIQGILLEPAWIMCGYAVLNEIKHSLQEFQKTGKKVYAYLERAGNKDYLLASVADEVYLNPSASAGILLTGIGSNVLFYKNLFDKIGVEVTVIHAGDYKGAGESYSRTEFSQQVESNIKNLFDDIFEKIITDLAEQRDISAEDAIYIYEDRSELFITNNKALEYGLVDLLLYQEDLKAQIGITEKDLISFKKYRNNPEIDLSGDQIAVVYLQGEIVESDLPYDANVINAVKLNDILDMLEKNTRIKGAVLRINSPGGSALESEIMHDRIVKFRQKKPLVVSMSNVAASGGYYISAPAEYIFADPYSITGSIGVATILPNFKKFADKIGITTDPIKKGKYVDILNPFVEPDDFTLKALKRSSDNIYREFKNRVSSGRDISFSELEKIAGGRVWSSDDALKYGLIDEIGILDNAILKSAEIAGLSDFNVKYYPEKKSLFEEILKKRFDLDLASILWKNQIDKQMGLQKLHRKYQNLINDPIQAIMTFEIE